MEIKEMTVVHPIQTTKASTAQTHASASTTGNATATSTAAAAGGLLPTITLPTLWDFLGVGQAVQQINFQDIAIRAGLVIVGVLLLLIVVAKALEKPTVEVAETAAKVE